MPGRASVVLDRWGRHLIVGVPASFADRVKALEGAVWDHDVRRWLVPVAAEPLLRGVLAGLEVSWARDHRYRPLRPGQPPTVVVAEHSVPVPAQGELW